MLETISAEELARDPGYPGMQPEYLAQTVYYAPTRTLSEADLTGFWVLEYRWPNGCTPYGLMFCELALTWAMQYASHHSPLPPTNGYDMRVAGTHLFGSELALESEAVLQARDHRLAQRLPRFVENFQEIWKQEIELLMAANRQIEAYDASGRSPAELAEYLVYTREHLRWSWERHFELMYLLLINHAGFYDLCTELTIPHADVATFLQGYDSRISQGDRALWEMVDLARQKNLASWFVGVDAGVDLLERMRSAGGEASRWAVSFDGFLNEWGWRTETVADPLSPSWIEDPGPVLGSIGSLLVAGQQPDFDAKRKAAEDEREAALDAVRSRLSRAEQRDFDQTLETCRKANFLWWNEDHNFYIDYRSGIPMRKAALGLGDSLDLTDPEDTVFCFYPELLALARGEKKWNELASLVSERKDYYWSWRERRNRIPKFLGVPPDSLSDPILTELDGFTPEFLETLKEDGTATTLKGMPASQGRAQGAARVLLGADRIHDIQPGEILVCEGTTPSWTPAFTKIAGCLTDQGGTLSHAAIVGREYGVPCVVALGNATARIRTGDELELDGGAGTVRILKRADP
ncbi:MAG: PEP-utilizing enzyme [Pseudomonadota bacterium]|nr:PEP-utilizing enzyme [Pseudomonadota bacterium]